MPATPTPVFLLPGPDLDDSPADLEAAFDPLRNRIEEILKTLAPVPIGVQLPYSGSVLPQNVAGAELGDVEFAFCDGSLIDRDDYAGFYAVAQHNYNGGLDPLGNGVRLPNKSGRMSIGAGTASNPVPAGATAKALGSRGGQESATMPSHNHGGGSHGHSNNYGTSASFAVAHSVLAGSYDYGNGTAVNGSGVILSTQGSGDNLPPWETDNWIVRIK